MTANDISHPARAEGPPAGGRTPGAASPSGARRGAPRCTHEGEDLDWTGPEPRSAGTSGSGFGSCPFAPGQARGRGVMGRNWSRPLPTTRSLPGAPRSRHRAGHRSARRPPAGRLALDLGIQRFADHEHEVPLDRREVADEPVVHPQPAAVAERMAVGLLNGRPDRRADMREEQMRTDVPGELAQVLVIPGRLDAAEDPGDRCGVIPADAEPVPVGRLAPSREPSSGRSANRPGAGHVCEQDRRTGIASQRHISRNFQPQADKDPAQVGNSRRSLMTRRRRAGPAHPPSGPAGSQRIAHQIGGNPRRTPWRRLAIRHVWSWALVTVARPG